MNVNLKLNPLATALIFSLSSGAYADEFYFPKALISDSENVADLSVFETLKKQAPGIYQVDVLLNNERLGSKSVHFVASEGDENSGLHACLQPDWFSKNGVMLKQNSNSQDESDDSCFNLEEQIPDSTELFDFQTMTLKFNIPQAFMKNTARDEVPVELWDEGVNALLLSYRFNGDQTKRYSRNSSSEYFSLESGLNVGPWRLRDNSVYTHYSNGSSRQSWKHLRTYVSRAVTPFKSELVVGEKSTRGDIFDSMDFRGVQLASDEDMYPDSMKGFAPVVRGIALSNARVTVKQNGYVIYQTYVSAGPFEIRDLYSMASSGDLTVLVTEADGQIRQFVVPYSAVPVLQRPGHSKYSLTAGKYRSGTDSKEPGFIEGTYIRGFENNITAYSGMQLGNNYKAASIGAGMNMGYWGAISADVTQANSELADGSHHQGQSLRFLYAHSFNSMGTTFQLTGYRYSTKGFYTLDETARKDMVGREGLKPEFQAGETVKDLRPFYNLNNSRRQRFVANISQAVGDLGTVYLTGSHQSYWNTDEASKSLQAGLSSNIGPVSYNISLGYSREPGLDDSDKTVSLSLSVPLGQLFGSYRNQNLYLTSNYTHSNDHTSQLQNGLNGTALEKNNLNWSIAQSQSKNNYEKHNNSSVNLNYQGAYGNVSSGYNYSSNEKQLNYGVAGGIVVHSQGVTFSQPLGESNILVAAPGANGAEIDNQTGVATDWRGYTVVPYATVYRENRISLNTMSLDDHTELDSTVSHVVPTRGALVKAEFKTRQGYRIIFTLENKGKSLPFGTVVSANDSSSIVGDDGQVYLTGLGDKGELKASWGKGVDQKCNFEYLIPEESKSLPVISITGICI